MSLTLTAVPHYMSLILTNMQLHFILFSGLDFNIETTVMVTSLLTSLHHAVIALILNPTTVRTVVLTSRPGRFTAGKYTGTFWVGNCLGARSGPQVLE
jgi:hypothetical protein